MVIKLKEVGRSKQEWELEVPDVKYNEGLFLKEKYRHWLASLIIDSIKERKVLLSKDIEVSISHGKKKAAGTIFVGVYRPVGKFEVMNEHQVAG